MTRMDQLVKDQKASINFFNPPTMAVQISELEEGQYMVNGKLIYKDIDSSWIATEELTVNENKEFKRHLKSKENG